jgi:hypothetical protein
MAREGRERDYEGKERERDRCNGGAAPRRTPPLAFVAERS